jgi:hypothetical protein
MSLLKKYVLTNLAALSFLSTASFAAEGEGLKLRFETGVSAELSAKKPIPDEQVEQEYTVSSGVYLTKQWYSQPTLKDFLKSLSGYTQANSGVGYIDLYYTYPKDLMITGFDFQYYRPGYSSQNKYPRTVDVYVIDQDGNETLHDSITGITEQEQITTYSFSNPTPKSSKFKFILKGAGTYQGVVYFVPKWK